MSGTLMLVNPRKRRGARKHRTAAQRAATKRMIAANRAKRSSNPSPRRRAKRRTYAANPIHARRRTYRRHHNPIRHHKRRRRNPISMPSLKIGQLMKVGAVGAGGALVVDVLFGYLGRYLPASVTAKTNADGSTNYLNVASKLGVAVLLGSLGRKVFKRHAATMAVGAVTVQLYNFLRPMISSAMPSLGLGYYIPAFMPAGQTLMPSQLGAYVQAGMPQAVSPASPKALGAYTAAPGYTTASSWNNVGGASNIIRESFVR